MIEESEYRLPDKQPVKKPKPKADQETERKLYDLGFRPHGYEW